MKIITKSKLPKWMIFILPFGEEESMLKEVLFPIVLFLVVVIWISVYELCNPSDTLNLWMALFFLGLFITSIWWLSLQADILHFLRLRLKLHYQVAKDEEEKVKTKKLLSDLCVKV